MIRNLKDGDILLLDNVRYVSEEQTLFEMKLKLSHEQQAKTLLVEKLAPLADCYVCDAFAAAHRDQPSLCGFEQVLPAVRHCICLHCSRKSPLTDPSTIPLRS